MTNVIFQCVSRKYKNGQGESLIINDPKSELYEDMASYLEENGYVVRVFNLVNPEHSDSWNCLEGNRRSGNHGTAHSRRYHQKYRIRQSDHFWDNAGTESAESLILYVERGFPEEGKYRTGLPAPDCVLKRS